MSLRCAIGLHTYLDQFGFPEPDIIIPSAEGTPLESVYHCVRCGKRKD